MIIASEVMIKMTESAISTGVFFPLDALLAGAALRWLVLPCFRARD
jgi:hypothetical protein